MLHTWATDTVDETVDPRFGKVGKQRIVDTGPLTRKRMETVDGELVKEGIKFMDKAQADGKPFFVWFATTRMHTFTHVPEAYRDKVKQYTSYHDAYGAGVIQHDEEVGMVLKRLDEMGIADNTIVIYSTDNGVEHSTFPHGGTTPFRSEKMTTWEGGVHRHENTTCHRYLQPLAGCCHRNVGRGTRSPAPPGTTIRRPDRTDDCGFGHRFPAGGRGPERRPQHSGHPDR